jgi:hypothetical protein
LLRYAAAIVDVGFCETFVVGFGIVFETLQTPQNSIAG